MQGYVYDIEANNLYLQSKEIWIIRCLSLDGTRSLALYPSREGYVETKEKFLEWHNSFGDEPVVVSFNGIGYDHWMLWKFLGVPFHIGKNGKDYLNFQPCKIIDLLVVSQMVNPDRPRHNLASYGEQFGSPKIDFNDFSRYSEELDTYCKQDVDLTLMVYNFLMKSLVQMYKDFYKEEFNQQYISGLKSLQKDYYLYSAQAFTGIEFDKEGAVKLSDECGVEMEQIEAEVLPQLPPRKLKEGEKKFYSLPAKPFKKDGTLSSTMEKWLVKHSATVNPELTTVTAYGEEYPLQANLLMNIKLPMEIKDGEDIKEWFQSQGWVPTFYNFKRDPETGKPMRDATGEVIVTSPKIQEAGKICPNLLEISGDLPKRIVRFLSLRNRQSVVNGWLSDWRLEFDGRLSAEITGYTPTFRVKHSNIVNLPKASPEVVKGFEMRALFRATKGMKYVSADAAALENRCVADYTFPYDNGAFAEVVLNGDSHSFNAVLFFPEETAKFDINSTGFSKDDPGFKPYRNKAKNGGYALAYGCSFKKLAKTLGISLAAGQIAYDNYWEGNLGLKLFKESIEEEWKSRGKKKYIRARDGKILSARSKHLLVNLSGQNLGATVITYALCMMDNKLGWLEIDELGRPYYLYKGEVVRRLAAFHDQGDFETVPELAEEVGAMLVQFIKKAGTMLKMQVELDGEYKVGDNAAEIH